MTTGRSPRWLAVAFLLLAGCGAARKPLAPNQRGVGEITFKGVNEVDPGDLKSGLGVMRARELGQPFARYLVALDRRRIEGYYLRHGFFSPTVETEITRRDRLTDVLFTITEGPRARLTRVDIVGLPPDVEHDELRDQIPLADNAPFEYAGYELARPTLATVLEEKGYAHAAVKASILANRDNNTAIIKLDVIPGPKAVFGKVEVTGVKGTLAKTVKARLSIKDGDPYSLHALAESRADLYELGRFSLVRLETDKADKGAVVPVEVKIGERPRHELRLGGGVGYSPLAYEVRGRAGYSVAGWPTTLMNSHAELRPAVVRTRSEASFQPRIEAIGTLERLDLFRPRLIGSLEGSFSYLQLEAYTSYGPRAHVALRSPLYKRIVSGSVGWAIQEMRFRDVNSALSPMLVTELGLDKPERIGAFDQALIVDLRDSPLAPTSGAYAVIRADEGTKVAGGAFDYVRVLPELRGYVTLAGVTLAARVGMGVITGDVPVTQRFYAGGSATQRGFSERRLSPMAVEIDADGNERHVPYGGAALVTTSVELRKHLWTISRTDEVTLGGVWFFDGADVTEEWSQIKLGNLHWATGGGLRLNYVVPIRIDIGYRMNRIGPMDPDPTTSVWGRLAFHLGIGEAF